jgi:uncharacterized protein
MGLTSSTVVYRPVDEVFAWHERPGALPRLAPPWQPLRVRSEAASLRDGRAVLGLPGGLRWVARHGGYDPPHRFVDELVSLPLAPLLRWRHIHEFSAEPAGATRVTDRVETTVPGVLLRQTFAYRHRQLADDLAVHQSMRRLCPDPMTVGITGASGLVGSALSALLTTGGHRVVSFVQHPARGPHERRWDPADPDSNLLEGLDALVHLADAPAGARPTKPPALRHSSGGATLALLELVKAAADGPKVLVIASSIHDEGAASVDTQRAGTDHGGSGGFLAGEAGVRVVGVRAGVVQSTRGGSLRLLRRLFLGGLGGRLGNGRQWISWIDLDDLVDVYYRALVDVRLTGPINAVAPNPVLGSEYSAALGGVLHRPARLPIPPAGWRLLLGHQGAAEVAVASQRVTPDRLVEVGHRFRRPHLDECLRHQLGHLRC